MRLPSSAVRIRPREIDAAVKVQAPVGVDVDVERLEVRGGVDEADLARLDKVVGDDDVLLVGRDLNVVRADGGLGFVRVVEALDVAQVGDVERGDVVCSGDGYYGFGWTRVSQVKLKEIVEKGGNKGMRGTHSI